MSTILQAPPGLEARRAEPPVSGPSEPLPFASAVEPLSPASVKVLDDRFNTASTKDVLTWAWKRFGTRAAIGTSFQGSGLVMIDLARRHDLNFPVFTLDTGLLFKQTLELKERLEKFFGIAIEGLKPDLTLEEQADINGPELWKRNPDLCCTIRKVMPLRDKLCDLDCWITGLRRQQSGSRSGIGIIELYVFDEQSGRDIVKLNPMANWTKEEIWSYIRERNIPYNPLHDQGYRSIGCEVCTVKSAAGENERAGRWTGFNKVECGIHTFLPKKLDFQI
jgi:phosphoadenosine phosphosulfate reductase